MKTPQVGDVYEGKDYPYTLYTKEKKFFRTGWSNEKDSHKHIIENSPYGYGTIKDCRVFLYNIYTVTWNDK